MVFLLVCLDFLLECFTYSIDSCLKIWLPILLVPYLLFFRLQLGLQLLDLEGKLINLRLILQYNLSIGLLSSYMIVCNVSRNRFPLSWAPEWTFLCTSSIISEWQLVSIFIVLLINVQFWLHWIHSQFVFFYLFIQKLKSFFVIYFGLLLTHGSCLQLIFENVNLFCVIRDFTSGILKLIIKFIILIFQLLKCFCFNFFSNSFILRSSLI